MFSALLFAVVTATATPAGTGVSGAAKPSTANTSASRTFSGGHVQPIHGTPNPLLKEAAPKPNTHATAGPLLRKAAPGSSANPHALRAFSGAGTAGSQAPGMGSMNGGWGWFGLFGVFGLVGLWRRYSGE